MPSPVDFYANILEDAIPKVRAYLNSGTFGAVTVSSQVKNPVPSKMVWVSDLGGNEIEDGLQVTSLRFRVIADKLGDAELMSRSLRAFVQSDLFINGPIHEVEADMKPILTSELSEQERPMFFFDIDVYEIAQTIHI